MYVASTAPLPQNSTSSGGGPVFQRNAARSRRMLEKLGISVATARLDYRQIAPPESFAQFGRNLVTDVTWAQSTFNRVGQQAGSCPEAGSAANLSSPGDIGSAALTGPAVINPMVVPLNGEITVPADLEPSLSSRVAPPWGDSAVTFSPLSPAADWKMVLLLGIAAAGLLLLVGGKGEGFSL